MIDRSATSQWLGTAAIPLLAVILASAAPPGVAAQHIPNAEAGRNIAEKWCTNCHVVSSTQSQATSTGAPPFAAVAEMPSTTAMSLRAFRQTPHWRMPDLHLTRDEIDDIAAYILSLRHQQ